MCRMDLMMLSSWRSVVEMLNPMAVKCWVLIMSSYYQSFPTVSLGKTLASCIPVAEKSKSLDSCRGWHQGRILQLYFQCWYVQVCLCLATPTFSKSYTVLKVFHCTNEYYVISVQKGRECWTGASKEGWNYFFCIISSVWIADWPYLAFQFYNSQELSMKLTSGKLIKNTQDSLF